MTGPSGGHARIYRSLLHLYPADFQAQYGEQMVQLFSDQIRSEGLVRSWFRTLGDVPGSAVSEHMRRNRTVAHSLTVSPTPLSRILGVLGIAGGLFLLAAFVVQLSQDVNIVRLVVFNLGAIAIAIAVHYRQRDNGRMLSLSGAIPLILANSVYVVSLVVSAIQPDFALGRTFLYFGAAMWFSDLWFALVTFRLGVLNRMSSGVLAIGSVAAFAGMDAFGLAIPRTALDTIIMAGLAVHALGWILLGLEVALRRTPSVVENH